MLGQPRFQVAAAKSDEPTADPDVGNPLLTHERVQRAYLDSQNGRGVVVVEYVALWVCCSGIHVGVLVTSVFSAANRESHLPEGVGH